MHLAEKWASASASCIQRRLPEYGRGSNNYNNQDDMQNTLQSKKPFRIAYKMSVKFVSRATLFYKNQTDFCLKKFFCKQKFLKAI